MPYKLLLEKNETIGSPYNGAASGVSVTISSTVMRGSTGMAGRFRLLKGANFYAPLWNDNTRILLQASNTTLQSTLNFPRLPTTLPARDQILFNPTEVLSYRTWTSDMSFSPPTISSTVMRASTAMDASYLRYRLVLNQSAEQNFRYAAANMGVELQIFGMINRMLYMDY